MPARRYSWLAAATILLAFLLRVYRLAELPPGLFFDEAFNILDGLAVFRDGYHPVFFAGNNGREPLFIYMQSVLVWVAGVTPFVIRFSAVILGTLTVALTYPLVLRLFASEAENRRQMIALLSTFLLATLQWHLNFSRVGFRAIAQPFTEAIAVYLLYRAVQSRRRSSLFFALSGVALGASAYTYLSARLVPVAIAALIVTGVVWGQRMDRRYIGGVVLAAATSIVTVAPLGLYYLRHPDAFIGHSKDVSLLNFGGWNAVIENELRLLGMFNWAGDVNWRHNLIGRPVFDQIVGLFFLVGVVVTAARLIGSLRRRLGLNGYLAPTIILPVMLLPSLLSEGAPHFLRGIGVLPFLALLPAVGIEAILRWLQGVKPFCQAAARWPFVGLVLLLSFNTAATYKAYFVDWGGSDQPYYHFDGVFVDAARYINALDADTRVYVTQWIADHATARLFLRGRPLKAFDSSRTQVLTDHKAVYAFHENGVDIDAAAAFPKLMPYPLEVDHLPDRFGKAAFDFFRLKDTASFNTKTVADLVAGIGRLQPALDGPIIQFGDDLLLSGFLLDNARDNQPAIAASAGVNLPLTLAWQASRRPADDYTVSLRLIDSQGRRKMQADGLIGGRLFPTSDWDTDELVLDRPILVVPPDLPPGDYAVELTVYSLQNRAGLEVKSAGKVLGQLAKVAHLRIAEPAPDALAALRPPHVIDAKIGDGLTLLGYGLDRDKIKAGETVNVELFWKAERAIGRDLDFRLELLDKSGGVVADRKAPPLEGSYPTIKWREGDGFRDSHRLSLSARALAGATTVRVSVVDRAAGTVLGVAELAGPDIADRPHVFEVPALQLPRPAKFGDMVELLGLNTDASGAQQMAAKPGSTLPIMLVWRGVREMRVSYTVFLQMLNGAGQLVAQHDGLPEEGSALTSSWLPGEIIADRHVVSLPGTLSPGEYTLIAGLYNAVDGKRLPTGDGDFVKLGTVQITP